MNILYCQCYNCYKNGIFLSHNSVMMLHYATRTEPDSYLPVTKLPRKVELYFNVTAFPSES